MSFCGAPPRLSGEATQIFFTPAALRRTGRLVITEGSGCVPSISLQLKLFACRKFRRFTIILLSSIRVYVVTVCCLGGQALIVTLLFPETKSAVISFPPSRRKF